MSRNKKNRNYKKHKPEEKNLTGWIGKYLVHDPSLNLQGKADMYVYLLMFLVLLLSFTIRFLYFNQNPPALNQDEAMNGYNAYSISKTFRDSRGSFLPFLVKGFGSIDIRPPLYAYLSVPFMWMMGLCETSTRMVGLLFNTALIFLVFILSNLMFKNRVIALLSAALLMLNPWNIHFSRLGHEGTLQPFFYFLSIILLYLGLNKNKKLLPLAGFAFGMTSYAYMGARILSPVIFLFICVIYYKEAFKKLKEIALSVIFGIAAVLPVIYVSFTDPDWAEQLNYYSQRISILGKPDIIGKFFSNYFMYFSPKFLFGNGESDSLPGLSGLHGMFQPYIALLFIIGIIYLIRILFQSDKFRKEIFLLFGLLLIYPLPAAFTSTPIPHAIRAYTLFPVIHIISAAGLWCMYRNLNVSKLHNKLKAGAYILIGVIIVYISLHFLGKYYFEYPKIAQDYPQYGMKEVVEYIDENQNKYDKIYITSHVNQPFIYVLFYTGYNPGKYISINKVVDYRMWGVVYNFDKYYFKPDEEMPLDEKRCLFVTRSDDFPGKKILKIVENYYGNGVFYIWE